MNTPWGKADQIEPLERGISHVGTPGHGGLMISMGYANKHLSAAARKQGDAYGGYLAYEEDSQWMIPMFELRHLWPLYFRNSGPNYDTPEKIYDYLWKSLSYWGADYLLEIGVAPSAKEYESFKQRAIEDEMRRAKSSHLIVTAWGDWDTKIPGVIRVRTANGREYHITEKSYDAARATGQILDIDNMEIVRTL